MTNHQSQVDDETSMGNGDRFKIADGTHAFVSLPSVTIPSSEVPAPLHPSSPPLRASRSTTSSKPASVTKLSSDAVLLSSDDKLSVEPEQRKTLQESAVETATNSASPAESSPASTMEISLAKGNAKLKTTYGQSKDDQRISTMLRKGRSRSVHDRSLSPDPKPSFFIRARSFPKEHAPQELSVPARCCSAPEYEDTQAGMLSQDEIRYYEELAAVERYWRELDLHNEELYKQSQISSAVGYDCNLYKNQRRHVSSGNKFYAHVVRSRAAAHDFADHDHHHANEHERNRRPTI